MARPDASTLGGGRSPPSETPPHPWSPLPWPVRIQGEGYGRPRERSRFRLPNPRRRRSTPTWISFLEQLFEARVDLVLMAHQLAGVIVHVLAAGVPADRSSAEKARQRRDERVGLLVGQHVAGAPDADYRGVGDELGPARGVHGRDQLVALPPEHQRLRRQAVEPLRHPT